MTFPQQLRAYLDELGCTPVELARACGISPSTLSRYLSGQRVPKPRSESFERLCQGIVDLGGDGFEHEAVAAALIGDAPDSLLPDDAFSESFRALVTRLGISGNRLARALGFDPSYISRIASGQRVPANRASFVAGTARYVARACADECQIEKLSQLIGIPSSDLATFRNRIAAVSAFLGVSEGAVVEDDDLEDALPSFLKSLDGFDLNDFLVNVRFDEIKVPTVPFALPTVKTYTGIEQMKQAELDFFRAAALSRSTEDVIMFSDMPIEEMGADEDFAKSVMLGIAVLVRKGIHLHIIHNVHRPLRELCMGLEAWIPLYMTGQLSSYYLPEPTSQTFLHFIRSAGSVAVAGEAIEGDQASGRYTVTKRSDDVAYYRTRALQLLDHAKPLISVFRDGDDDALAARLEAIGADPDEKPIEVGEGVFRNMTVTVVPGRYALIAKEGTPCVRLLTEYPALFSALEEFQPMLFSEDRQN